MGRINEDVVKVFYVFISKVILLGKQIKKGFSAWGNYISTKHNSLVTTPDNRNQSASPATNQNTAKHHLQKGDGTLPRKLVRGQDVWLGKVRLRCVWSSEVKLG